MNKTKTMIQEERCFVLLPTDFGYIELLPMSSTGRTKKGCDEQKIQSVTFQFFFWNRVTSFQMFSMASSPCGHTMDSGCVPSGVSLKKKMFFFLEIIFFEVKFNCTLRKTCAGCSLRFLKCSFGSLTGEEEPHIGGRSRPFQAP